MRTLGETISSQRRIKGYSQELLAERCGTSLRTIQRLENNQSTPRAYTLKLIADSLDIDLNKLDPTATNKSATPEGVISADALTRIKLINSSALLGIIFPGLQVLVPLVVWYINRNHQLVNETGKKIISFQLVWSLTTFLILLTIQYLQFKLTSQFLSETVPAEFIGYVLLLVINMVVVLKNAVLLRDGNSQIYPSVPGLF